jgi:hypothetical protein
MTEIAENRGMNLPTLQDYPKDRLRDWPFQGLEFVRSTSSFGIGLTARRLQIRLTP